MVLQVNTNIFKSQTPPDFEKILPQYTLYESVYLGSIKVNKATAEILNHIGTALEVSLKWFTLKY